MVTAVINHENLYIHPVMDDGLQLLDIHLKAAVPCNQYQVIPGLIASHAVALVFPGCSPGPNGCRQVISHGCDG